jgi:hypothetical protein
MTTYLLSWDVSDEVDVWGEEEFKTKGELKERLDELRQKYQFLEWTIFDVKRCRHCKGTGYIYKGR